MLVFSATEPKRVHRLNLLAEVESSGFTDDVEQSKSFPHYSDFPGTDPASRARWQRSSGFDLFGCSCGYGHIEEGKRTAHGMVHTHDGDDVE